jgi:hypothetical protein
VKLPATLHDLLKHRVLNYIERQPPTRIIRGVTSEPYMLRWELRGNSPVFDVYLHRFLRSDDISALHDHPAVSVAIILSGRYREWLATDRYRIRNEGEIIFRAASTPHRIEIDESAPGPITIFLRGPKLRQWGFHCANGWLHHKDFRMRGCDS